MHIPVTIESNKKSANISPLFNDKYGLKTGIQSEKAKNPETLMGKGRRCTDQRHRSAAESHRSMGNG